MLKTAIFCLALNIYFESRGEPEIGQIAVAHVTNNRAIKNNSSICTEVFKKGQFSWTKTKYKIPKSTDVSWKKSLQIASTFKQHPDPTTGCLYFSRNKITLNNKKSKHIGNHRFH